MKERVEALYRAAIEPGRMKGNSARIIDAAIKILFDGNIAVIHDHVDKGTNTKCNELLFEKVLARLKFEHRLDVMLKQGTIRIDKKNLEIELLENKTSG